jgi:hypothetical protein
LYILTFSTFASAKSKILKIQTISKQMKML